MNVVCCGSVQFICVLLWMFAVADSRFLRWSPKYIHAHAIFISFFCISFQIGNVFACAYKLQQCHYGNSYIQYVKLTSLEKEEGWTVRWKSIMTDKLMKNKIFKQTSFATKNSKNSRSIHFFGWSRLRWTAWINAFKFELCRYMWELDTTLCNKWQTAVALEMQNFNWNPNM